MSGTRATLVVGILSVTAAFAGAAPVTYVSVSGRDAGACVRRAPCRTFAGALPRTDPNGTIVALDSGVFSSRHLDIRQPVTLSAAPGVHAELYSGEFAAVSINAGASDTLVLRGLTIAAVDGAPTPLNGIVYNNAASLLVEDCVIQGFPTKGILALSHGRLTVVNTLVQGSFVGISLDASVRATLDRVRLEGNEWGLGASFGARATIRDSIVSGSTSTGLFVYSGGSQPSELTVVGCVVDHNGTGAEAMPDPSWQGILRLSDNTITDNDVGVRQSGASVAESRGNNTIRGNATDVVGSLATFAGR